MSQRPQYDIASVYRNGLLATSLLLTVIGLVMVYAASAMKGLQQFSDVYFFIRKQLLVGVAGFIAIVVIGRLSEKQLRLLVAPAFLGSLFLLSLIFVPGVYSSGGGAARWINLFGIRFQTSELAKIGLVFFLAKNLSKDKVDVNSFKTGLLPNLIALAVFALFMMKQPDFGSTVLVALVAFVLLVFAGLSRRYIFAAISFGLVAICAAVIAAPYRLARLTSFMDPWSQIQNGGFQIIQSYLAFHNGGFAGVGLGESKQKLFFLPEAHTDFILAVIGEELGFLGVSCVVALFGLYMFYGIQIAKLQKQSYHRYLAYGLTSLIGLQALINMSVAMGLLPTKGIPLPFISSGASSLLVSLVITGFILRIAKTPGLHQNQKTH